MHGSPDARARGYVMEDLDLISANAQGQSNDESDGGIVTVDGKRRLVYRRTGSVHLSQLFTTNIVAAFTEHNLHPEEFLQ